ncbi:cleavage and polyadenylation specificity factor subunit 1 [Palaemon carinicauda]|uniref:cleavage and polyadenylation specificity factor subunit 1 n=1 Tax=Palaemon carinicauda TaxID=392227 RepID=UPI0035B58C45
MYNLCKITHPPLGVEYSLYCHFFNHREKSLVVAGANILRVFRLVADVPSKGNRLEDRAEDGHSIPPKVKLECMATYKLHDNVATMASVSLSPLRDSLLLGFKDAKLSVVEYDPFNHNLRTVSLHYFEKEDIRGGWVQTVCLPLVRVDPEARCAAMLIFGKKIVILPFRRDLATDDVEFTSGPFTRGPVQQSYIIDPKTFETNIDNILDMQFLHGYYDPTLMLLYEPIKTFPGRVAVRQDTCALAAISLNIRQRLHPVIWSISSLPHDCIKLLPVPKPIGGVLLFAYNSLTYLTQSVPPYGVSLNSMGDKNTNFPLRKQEGVVISLDCAYGQFLTEDRVVISLKGGELYVLTLVADSMRSVRSFHFDKAAASVLTCSMTVCEDQYLFLGSRLGNSLLLRYTEKDIVDTLRSKSNVPNDQEPPTKRKKLDTLGDWIASNVDDIRDDDALEVYGQEDTSTVQLSSYNFEVMDSLLNIGPCGDVAMGEPAFLSEEYESTVDPCVELVLTSGHGKNGALSILQRSIKPQVLTTFDLPEVEDMWTLVGKTDERRRRDANLQDHSFLILSRSDSSLILRTEEEINELEESGFNTTSKTVFAGNIGNNRYIVQVTSGGVRLLEGTVQIQHVPVDVGWPLVYATLADPYLAVLAEDGTLMIFTFITSRYAPPKLYTTKPVDTNKSPLQTICAYCDVSGLFTYDYPEDSNKDRKIYRSDADIKKELDDEDEMLYGNAEGSVFDPPKTFTNPLGTQEKHQNEWWRKWQKDVRASFWLVGIREDGNLEIYTLPDFRLSYAVKNFWMGHRVLIDSSQVIPPPPLPPSTLPPPPTPVLENYSIIHEVLLVGMGNRNLRPVLFARVDEDLLMYEVFPFYENLATNQLKIRMRLIEHNLILRERRSGKKKRSDEEGTTEKKIDRTSRFRPFSNISVYSGVFISGSYPHWVFMTVRGELRYHPMSVDGSVKCFAPFRNINCQNGFLYFNRHESLRICLLPTILSYDAPWPVRKVPLRCTPHFIVHHLETKTYCVVTSTSDPTLKIWKFNGDDKEEVIEERDERFLKVQAPVFSIQLFSPVNWQMIPNTDYTLELWEHITCCKNVILSYEGDRSGLRGYIALGTTFAFGEDITCRGRIFIFDVIDVVPEPGQPLTKNRLKLLYEGEQKGPVTALAHCRGLLVSAIGQKVYIWQLKDADLVGIAFIDTQIYIHQLLCIKSLILAADICKSVLLLRFQDENRTLSLVSRDLKPLQVYGVQFLVDNSSLAFIAGDADKNLVVFTYNPESHESMGGTRLIRKGEFHLGANVNSFFRIRCRVGDVSSDKRAGQNVERKHITMMATLDGSIGYVLPVSERTYRRFSMVYNLLVQHLPHIGGLNPKAARAFQNRYKLITGPSRAVLDAELIWSFLHMPAPEKIEIAKKIGAKVDDIVEDLMEIDRMTAHF